MKTILALFTFAFLGGCGSAQLEMAALATDQDPISRVSDSPKLSELFAQMSEAASEGASLAYFGHSQNFWYDGDIHQCQKIGGAAVVIFFDAYVRDIFSGGGWDVPEPLLADAKVDFQKLIGDGQYYHCHKGEGVFMGWNDHNFFIGRDGKKVRLKLTAGYED